MLTTSFVGVILVLICFQLISVKFQRKTLSICCVKNSSPAAQDFIHFVWDFLAPGLRAPLPPNPALCPPLRESGSPPRDDGLCEAEGGGLLLHVSPVLLCFELRA